MSWAAKDGMGGMGWDGTGRDGVVNFRSGCRLHTNCLHLVMRKHLRLVTRKRYQPRCKRLRVNT